MSICRNIIVAAVLNAVICLCLLIMVFILGTAEAEGLKLELSPPGYDSGLVRQEQVPSSPAIKAGKYWEITAMTLELGTRQGLVSRDKIGQGTPGHTTVYLTETGLVSVRHQGLDSQVVLQGTQPVLPGVKFTVDVSIGPVGGLAVWQDGKLIGHSAEVYPLSGNDLPMTMGELCWACDGAGVGTGSPVHGAVRVRVFDYELARISGMGIS